MFNYEAAQGAVALAKELVNYVQQLLERASRDDNEEKQKP
jgi:hypothetical protein